MTEIREVTGTTGRGYVQAATKVSDDFEFLYSMIKFLFSLSNE